MNFKKQLKLLILIILLILVVIFSVFISIKMANATNILINNYKNNQSQIIKDRNGVIIKIKPNNRGDLAEHINYTPEKFTKALIQKEDKTFYFHPGINLKSTFRAVINYFILHKRTASSTITQQLAKILLAQENDRTPENKIKELFYTFSLENYLSKKTILQMYENSIYFGNKIEGISLASRYYYNTSPDLLNNDQIMALINTMPNPAKFNPFVNAKNQEVTLAKSNFKNYINSNNYFELKDFLDDNNQNTTSTIDSALTDKIREIAKRNIDSLSEKNATNTAIVVLKYPENEIISIVGSQDPTSTINGAQINMATKTRPIGSTIKPFIYTKAFEKDLRPYTEVEDKEYKYTTNDGFAFYPKNYDYQYRGLVNLHYSLSNSLNVPTVKVLEYCGMNNFYNFLTQNLEFKPTQNITNYELSIALGGLEMDLVSLAYYYSVFSNNGKIIPLQLFNNQKINSTSTNLNQNKTIYNDKYIELTNKILSDRKTGVDQFGLSSNLNVSGVDYALKTGTSREFHDSYTIGYTKDFLVAVWVGNSNNTPMDEVSGQTGAGSIWHEVMNLMSNSQYNKHNKFNYKNIKEYQNNGNIEYGLSNDNYEKYKNILKDTDLIIQKPHNGDEFEFDENIQIPLISNENVEWFINDKYIETNKNIIFKPKSIGTYIIKAIDSNNNQNEIKIYIEKKK